MSESSPSDLGLYCILLGCTPRGRHIEQHDVFFGVARKLDDLSDTIKGFWYRTILSDLVTAVRKVSPDIDTAALQSDLMTTLSRRDKVHIDAWTQVRYVDGYRVTIREGSVPQTEDSLKLFFINLGGYRENEFEEHHRKLFMVAPKISEVFERIMALDFMKEYSPDALGIAGGAHLDDQHRITMEADDVVSVSEAIGEGYTLVLEPVDSHPADVLNVGYTHINYPED